ncbi:hypothetical protein J2S74_002853 [Evansella vedderi]|uniref:Uncharacterized protein n=1 Tax=Evansella vedderi TaxID=38282 RepID=A0ABT9ZW65_9BACI|nr:hypothetical protein [Evansella vedderi]MDQ0255471.1 hypothetical protein [Evansella vedderi]
MAKQPAPKYSLDEVNILIRECLYHLKVAECDEEVRKRAAQLHTIEEYKRKFYGESEELKTAL